MLEWHSYSRLTQLQQIEVVELVVVLGDMPLDLLFSKLKSNNVHAIIIQGKVDKYSTFVIKHGIKQHKTPRRKSTLDVSTQVTKSSMERVTKKAGSVTRCGPTRTCPCSTNSTAFFTVSAIFMRTITTGRRRRQNDEALIFSQLARDCSLGMSDMSNSFVSKPLVRVIR